MKRITDFTPEIKAKIPIYKELAVKELYNGTEAKNWKRKDTVDYIEYIYKLGKQENKPVVIVAKNLIEYRMFYNLLFNDKVNQKYTKLVNKVFNVKNKKKELNSKLHLELDSELNSELRSELSSELYSELRSELSSELHSELYSKLRSELHSELDSELDSELSSELDSELHSELDSELDSELSSELDSELHSELDSELDSELSSELDSELYSELHSELYSELRSELDSELDSELYSELDSELYKTPNYHWLFLANEYSRVYLMWYKFIKDEFKLNTKKYKELDWLSDNVNKSHIAKVFLCKKVCLVLTMPNEIKRNEKGFHSIDLKGAIIYDNQKFHYLNGKKVPNWIFDKYFNKTLSAIDFKNCAEDEDKVAIVTLIKENFYLNKTKNG
jgi:hypothetical protein